MQGDFAEQQTALSGDDRADVLRQFRERGAKLGCEALIVSDGDSQSGPIDLWGTTLTKVGYKAVCIQYQAPPTVGRLPLAAGE